MEQVVKNLIKRAVEWKNAKDDFAEIAEGRLVEAVQKYEKYKKLNEIC